MEVIVLVKVSTKYNVRDIIIIDLEITGKKKGNTTCIKPNPGRDYEIVGGWREAICYFASRYLR